MHLDRGRRYPRTYPLVYFEWVWRAAEELPEPNKKPHPESSLHRECVRMQDAGYPGSPLAKTLIIHHEPSDRINVILVPEALGF
jgi:hypothetical protein